MIWFVLKALFK